jgi:hypothetical protein
MNGLLKSKKMKRLGNIFIICVLFLLAGHKGYAQTKTQQVDSLKLKEQKSQSAGNGNEQSAKGNENNQTGNRYGNQTAKRVRSGRPDMTRARGARPPSIVRPSGSGIPKGVGKPGGAGHKGGR